MTGLQTFDFHGDELALVQDERGLWVVVKRVCEALGVGFGSQTQKLHGKPWATVTTIVTVAEDGKPREMFAIHLDSLPMWLATIEPKRVDEKVRPKLERYQVECAKVLRDRFLGPPPAPPPAVLPAAELVAQLAVVTDRLTAMEAKLATLGGRPDYPGGVIGPREASASVLSPLRALARQLAHIRGAKYRSVLLKLDKRLRRLVSYPNDNGQGWDRFPADRYGELTSAVGLLQSDARGEIKAHAERVAREAQMPLGLHDQVQAGLHRQAEQSVREL